MKTILALVSAVYTISFAQAADPHDPHFVDPHEKSAAEKYYTYIPLIGVGALATASAIALGLAPITLALGRKKRSLQNDNFEEALKYFELAMKLDSEFCLPQVLCEAASQGNKATTKLQKSARKTAKVG